MAKQKSIVLSSEESVPESRTLLDQTYRRLRNDIITGVHPPGSKLRIEALRGRYNVSAGTLRESLSRLIAESLVDAIDQRGFRVTPVSRQDLEDLTNTRIHLEGEALRQSIGAGDDAWEADLVSAYYLLTRAESKPRPDIHASIEEWEERNRAFHVALIAASPSLWLKKLLDVLYRQWARYRFITLDSNSAPKNLHDEHRAIYEAALARDAEKACTLLTEHVRATARGFSKPAAVRARMTGTSRSASARSAPVANSSRGAKRARR